MARTDNNYGPGGSNHDEFGALPEKRIEKMHGSDTLAIAPVRLSDLKYMVADHFAIKGEKPTRLIYPGPKCNVTTMGAIIDGFGYVNLDLINIPNAPETRLE